MYRRRNRKQEGQRLLERLQPSLQDPNFRKQRIFFAAPPHKIAHTYKSTATTALSSFPDCRRRPKKTVQNRQWLNNNRWTTCELRYSRRCYQMPTFVWLVSCLVPTFFFDFICFRCYHCLKLIFDKRLLLSQRSDS